MPSSPGLRHSLTLLARLSAAGDGMGFARLRAETRLPAATLARLLKVLAEEGWVTGGGNRPWQAGPAFRTSAVRLIPHVGLGELLQPLVTSLAEATGESAAVVEWCSEGIRFLAKDERPDSYHYLAVGATNPAVTIHPFGQLLLAHLPVEERRPFAAAIRRAKLDLSRIQDESSRQQVHIASDRGLRYCAGIPDAAGRIRLCIGVSLLPRPLTPRASDELAEAVRQHARRAAELLIRRSAT